MSALERLLRYDGSAFDENVSYGDFLAMLVRPSIVVSAEHIRHGIMFVRRICGRIDGWFDRAASQLLDVLGPLEIVFGNVIEEGSRPVGS